MTSPNAATRERLVSLMLTVFAFSSLFFLFLIFIFILIEGLPLFFKVGVKHIILGFKWAPTRGSFGIFPMIVSSCMVTVGALLIGAPMGLGCAIYLAEYAGKKGRIYLKPSLELLAGIPSVVYGFLGVVYIVPVIREQLGGSGFSLLTTSLMDSGRSMAVHFYILAREGISMEKAYATALVLVLIILAINAVAYYLMHRITSKYS